MCKKNPIKQISPIEFFSKEKEPLPAWLKNHQAGMPVRLADLLSSRIVYYPGAGNDGSPIRTFNVSHTAHVFVYVDYGVSKEVIDKALSDSAFTGYHLHHQQTVSQKELLPHAPRYHINEEEKRIAISGYDMAIRPEDSFAILKIYERNEGFGENHGAWRFAILYIGTDANTTYDALFGNTDYSPYACVVCNNMGSGYSCFTKHSLIEQIAIRTNRFPKYLLCVKDYGWDGYNMLRTVSGTGASAERFVWTKSDGTTSLDDLDEDLKNVFTFSDED